MYRRLQPDLLVETITALRSRIHSRFPESGLLKVCDEVLVTGQEAQERADAIARPQHSLRLLVVLVVVAMIGLFMVVPAFLRIPQEGVQLTDFVEVFEAGINLVVLIGAGIVFLWTAETRIKRSRALDAMHELRCFAHVIDMHQLTKDPSRLLPGAPTAVSPKYDLTPFLLSRYLDYCSELLALVAKIAALYITRFNDPVVLTAVNEIDDLTSSISQKIWHKLMIIYQTHGVELARPQAPAESH